MYGQLQRRASRKQSTSWLTVQVGSGRRRYCALAAVLGLVWSLPAPAGRSHAAPGLLAPDFVLHAVAGSNVRLSEHIGQVVVISFWGSGCDACRAQLEFLDQDFRRYQKQGLLVYGVEVADEQAAALHFALGTHVTFPLLLDPAKSVARLYDVDNLPMTVLIDRDGKIRQVVRDFNETSRRDCEDELHRLLAE